MKNRMIGFVTGVIITALVFGLAGAALAAYQKDATLYYNDIKITLNGQVITPKDASGNIAEPFIIEGTTYLPVRAVSNALGMDVEWDDTTHTVKLQTINSENVSAHLMAFLRFMQDIFADIDYSYGWVADGKSDLVYSDIITTGQYQGLTGYEAEIKKTAENLQLLENYYSLCYSFNVLTSDDILLMGECRRLGNQLINDFSVLKNASATGYAKERIVYSAFQNALDCIDGEKKAESRFWEAYISSFSN